MTTSRFNRLNRRRFVASSALGGAAILTAGQVPLVGNRASAPAAMAQDSSADVPMFRGNAARTGEMPGPGPDDSNGLEVIWQFEITGEFWPPSPAVVNGVVYVGSSDGNLYAIGGNDGIERWRFATGESTGSSPAVVDNTVYVGNQVSSYPDPGGEYLYAINAEDGTERWRFAIDGIATDTAVVDEIVYVGSSGNLYAVNVDDGTERWRYASSWVLSPLTVADGVVYFMGNRGLSAVSVEDGSELWRVELSKQGAISLAMVDGVVYVMSRLASPRPVDLLAINAKDGTERWRFAADAGTGSSAPAVVDGVVYFGGDYLYAVDVTDGTERWRFATSDANISSPVVADGVVYVGSNDRNLYAVDAANGAERWRFPVGSNPVTSSPVVIDGVVYVVSDDGYLYAIGARAPRLTAGGTARVTQTTLLRGGPAPTAVERAELDADTVVTITGKAETSGDAVWWPVTVDGIGDSGWVEASMLEPLSSGPEPTATL